MEDQKHRALLGRGVEVLTCGLLLLLGARLAQFLEYGGLRDVLGCGILVAFVLVPSGLIVVVGEVACWRRWTHWRTWAGVILVAASVVAVPVLSRQIFQQAIVEKLRPRKHRATSHPPSLPNKPLQQTGSPP
jgi:cytochrome c oxidase subunit IV